MSPADPALRDRATRVPLPSLAALPSWLEAAVHPERTRAALLRAAPELGEEVAGLEPGRVRLRDASGAWQASYELRLRDGTTVPLVGRLVPPDAAWGPAGASGPPAWDVVLPELGLHLSAAPPERLEAVPRLTDAELARPLLESAIRAGGRYPDLRIERCEAEVMRFKPGSRCTVRYRLDLGAAGRPEWPRCVVAKTYHGGKGENAYAGMEALWGTPLSRGDVVTLAEPLAYVPEERILVQGPVAEDTTLKALVVQTFASGGRAELAALAEELDKTADGLAALHRTEAWHGDVWSLGQEVGELREAIGRLAVVFPERVAEVEALLGAVDAADRDRPADPARPAHGSFRPAQVLLHAGRIGFIDFDGFGRAEPAADVGLFLATTRRLGVVAAPPARRAEAAAALDELTEGFLVRYSDVAPVTIERVRLWEAVAALTAVLNCWTKVRPGRLGPTLLLLDHHLRASGLA